VGDIGRKVAPKRIYERPGTEPAPATEPSPAEVPEREREPVPA